MSDKSVNVQRLEQLKKPFAYEDIKTMVKQTFEYDGVTKGLLLFYVNSRAIQNRLDEVYGPFNWYNEFTLWQTDSQICGITLYDEENQRWITKYDGAGNTEFEAIKGGLSESFKRAAVMWGVGRYLDKIDKLYVKVKKSGKSFYPDPSEEEKIKNHYQQFLKKLSGASNQAAPENTSQSNQKQPSSQPKGNTPPKQNNADKQQSTPANIFYVKTASITGQSKCVVLMNSQKQERMAYIPKDDPIDTNHYIANAVLEKKESEFGPYYLLKSYEPYKQDKAKAA